VTDESRAVMSTKISTRANRLVRDIVVGFFQRIGGPRLMSDEHVTALRVLVGMAMREAAMIGAEYAARRLAPKPAGATQTPKVPQPAPARTTDTPPDFSDKTTEKMPRR
jgi:hypothetical protein